MSKKVHIDMFVKRPRALNDLQLAGVLHALGQGTFEVRATFRNPRDLDSQSHDYTFDQCGAIKADGHDLKKALGDIQGIIEENAYLNRVDGGLRRANEEFATTNEALSTQLRTLHSEIEGVTAANANLLNRCASVESRLLDSQASVAPLNSGLETLRERYTNLEADRERLSAELAGLLLEKTGLQDANEALRRELDSRADTTREQIELRDANIQLRDEKIAALTAKLDARDADDSDQVGTIRQLREALSGADTEIRKLSSERAHFETKCTNLHTSVTAIAKKRDNLEDLVSTLSQSVATANHAFRMADSALSDRNDTIARMSREFAEKRAGHESEVLKLSNLIGELSGANEALRRNVTHYACEAQSARDAVNRKIEPVKLDVTAYADGSVRVATDSHIVVSPRNLVVNGAINIKGAMSA